MLLYGDANQAKLMEGVPDTIIFSLTSLSERYPRLHLLNPPNFLGSTSEKEFDINYMRYILEVDQNFYQFMSIIYPLYMGKNVYICNGTDPYSEMLIESLLKIIQQRYGYNATRINHINDLFTAELTDFESSYGLANLDVDKERYSYIYEQERLRSGGISYASGQFPME